MISSVTTVVSSLKKEIRARVAFVVVPTQRSEARAHFWVGTRSLYQASKGLPGTNVKTGQIVVFGGTAITAKTHGDFIQRLLTLGHLGFREIFFLHVSVLLYCLLVEEER